MKSNTAFLTGFKKLLSKRKLQAGLILVALLGGASVWYFRAGGNSKSAYATVRVDYGDITQTISASGTVEPVREVTLTFKSEGYVESCTVHVGDRVKAGQVLAVERQSDLQHTYEQAQAALASAQANYEKLLATKPHEIAQLKAQIEADKISLDNAKSSLDRSQALFEASIISQSELESAKEAYQSALTRYQSDQSSLAITSNDADIKAALAEIKAAQSRLEQARDNLNDARIIAPFDGYVAEINGNVGQWTRGGASSSSSSDSDQFYIYLSSTELQLSAKINEADISKVKTGQKVTFTVDTYPDKTFTGKIAYLAPMATTVNNVQMFDAKITIDDYSLLKSGLPASIKIIVSSASHVLTVPQDALSFAQTYMQEAIKRRAAEGSRRGADGSAQYGSAQYAAAGQSNPQWGGSYQSGSYVVVLRNGRPELRQVQTGISDDLNVEIKSGLQRGDLVVVRRLVSGSNNNSSSASSNSGGSHRSSGIGGMPGMGPGPVPGGGR